MTPALSLDDVTFTYALGDHPVLDGATLEVPEGAFALLVGATGSGKSTLMRLAKPEIAPAGSLEGAIRVFGDDARGLGPVESARAVGYVFQSPDAQVVCDTVWHEMAFGLENLGVPADEMRRRVAETCLFFGMEPLFRRKTAELSGGQRQMLALAATLAMRPRLLLLDEPTSMLDPLAEKDFLSLLFRVNRELGVTVVVATHAPERMRDYATCAYRIADGRVSEVALGGLGPREKPLCPRVRPMGEDVVVSASDLWFRYERESDWVLRGLDLELRAGEVRALVGANGAGKSTLLALAAGAERAQRGRLRNALAADQALLPQNPNALLSCATVSDELAEWEGSGRYTRDDARAMLSELGLAGTEARHPYDLSGGQQQLLALAKLLLLRPRLLLLDEPTCGLDASAHARVCRLVAAARDSGTTVLVSTHDLGLVGSVADTVSLVFDGQAIVTEPAADYLATTWLS